MQFSIDTLHVLEFLDYTTGGTLRKRNDLGIILETLAENNKPELANELIFYGSALWKTHKILKSSEPNELLAKVQSDVDFLFIKITEIISSVTTFFKSEREIERFHKVYLKSDFGSKMNIIDLCYDLNELKKVQNTLKGK